MKKTILLTALLVGLGAAPALAITGPYVSGSVGLGFLNDSDVGPDNNAVKYNTGYALNGAVGYNFEMGRLEAALGYQRNDIDSVFDESVTEDSRASIFSVMANGYLDFEIRNSELKPYVMAGLGIADVDMKAVSFGTYVSDSETVFAWQVGAGVGIDAGSNLTVDIGYRFFSPDKANLAGEDVSFDSHMIMAGVRYDF